MNALFEAYSAALERRWLAPGTIVCNLIALRNLDAWLGEHGIDAARLDPLTCEHYFAEQLDQYQIVTMRHRLSVIRSAYRYAVRHHLAAQDPTADVKLPRLPDQEPRTYTNDELRAILAAVRTHREERTFFLYAYTGIRQGEAAALRWDQIDWKHDQIKLLGKAGKLRLIPLHPILRDILKRHQHGRRGDYINSSQTGGPLSTSSWYQTTRGLVDRAGITARAPSHTFRKTVATVMYEQGVREHVIDQIMGWAPRTVRDRHYIRVAPKTMRDAINTLYQDDPIYQPPDAPAEPAPTAIIAEDLRDELNRLLEIERQLRRQHRR